MGTHLEYVTGSLGELSVLPCACARPSDHARPTSTAEIELPVVPDAAQRLARWSTAPDVRAVSATAHVARAAGGMSLVPARRGSFRGRSVRGPHAA